MKKLYAILSLWLCVTALFASSWSYPSSTPSTPFGGGTGTIDNPYIISTPQHLANLAYNVNNGTTYQGCYFKLLNDITLNEGVLTSSGALNTSGSFLSWTPIGNGSHAFKGYFDGNGHCVNGIYINSSTSYCGLFGSTSWAKISNLGITDSYINGSDYVGGIAGQVSDNTTISSCYNAATIEGAFDVGGIVGQGNYDIIVLGCVNSGNISASASHVGGICGYVNGTVRYCYNSGKITGTGNRTGGILGETISTLSHCASSGVINITGTYTSYGAICYGSRPSSCYYMQGTCNQAGGGSRTASSVFSNGGILPLIDPSSSYLSIGMNGIPMPATLLSYIPTVSEDVVIGTEPYSSTMVPYGNYYRYSTVEMIYTPSEVGSAGIISSISFDVAKANTYAPSSVNIYMGYKNSGTFNGSSDYVSPSDLTLVYSGSPTLGASTGWETINLTNQFQYNGSDNLVIAVCKKASGYTQQLLYHYTPASEKVLYRRDDSASSYGEITNTSGTFSLSGERPNILIHKYTYDNSSDAPAVNTTDISDYPYAVYASNVTGKKNTQITIPVNLKNSNTITLWQADLELPAGFTIATDSYGEPLVSIAGSRTNASRHSVAANVLANGKTRILYSSTTNKTLTGNDGLVAYVTVNANSALTNGEYAVKLSNVLMVEPNETRHETSEVVSKITIKNYTLGDVNDDGMINGVDLVGIVNYILQSPKPGNIMEAADVNCDGVVDGSDYVREVNTILGTTSATSAARPSGLSTFALAEEGYNLFIDDCTAKPGEQVTLSLKMDNATPITLWQADLVLPEGITIARDEFDDPMMMITGRTTLTRHSLASNQLADGSIRMLCSSTTNKNFSGTSGEIVQITLNVPKDMAEKVYDIQLKNILLVEASEDKHDVLPTIAKLTVGNPTGTATVKVDKANDNSRYFNTLGQQFDKLPASHGVFIKNGKKYMK